MKNLYGMVCALLIAMAVSQEDHLLSEEYDDMSLDFDDENSRTGHCSITCLGKGEECFVSCLRDWSNSDDDENLKEKEEKDLIKYQLELAEYQRCLNYLKLVRSSIRCKKPQKPSSVLENAIPCFCASIERKCPRRCKLQSGFRPIENELKECSMKCQNGDKECIEKQCESGDRFS